MEKDFEELKTLFQQKKYSAVLSAQGVDQKAKTALSSLKRNHRNTIITFIGTAVAIVLIDQVSATKMQTSSIGFWILLGSALYYALSKTFLLYRLQAINPMETVWTTIQKLESYKNLNTIMHTYGEVAYVMVLAIGVYLYLRPILDKFLLDHTGHTILCFWWIWGACIAWIFFYTFVIKRKRLQKDILLLQTYIQSLKPEIR